MSSKDSDDHLKPEVRWTFGCLVAAASLVGLVILALLIALALQPAEWIQVLLGVFIAGGAGVLAWLVATALGQSRIGRRPR